MKWNGKELINIIAKISFGIIAILLLVLVGYELFCKEYVVAIIFFLVAIFWNPIVIDFIFKKIGGKPDYFYFVTVLYGSTGWFFACTLCIRFGDDYQNGLKFLMYIIYLFFLFMTKDWNKVKKYKIFGFIYVLSIILGYMSENMTNDVIDFLNFIHITESLIDINVWELLVNGVINPVKEAILTYIIFDTIIKNEETDKGEQLMTKDSKKENKGVENHIIVEDKKIVLENITSDIELETNELCISIKKK